jgi:hypothetical protein
MNASGRHCPFLNRSDPRCSEYFSLDHLGHAFTHCFGQYQACPQYQLLLTERQLRGGGFLEDAGKGSSHAAPRLVQIALPTRYAQPVAVAARVPAVSGV